MSNLDIQLRETFDRVAQTTKVNRRVEEIVQARRRRRPSPFTVAVAAFGVVAAVFALPMLIGGSPTHDVAGDLLAPTGVASTPSTSVNATTVPGVDGASAIAAQLGGSALTDEELQLITGYESDMAYSGYLIDSTTTADGSYELGLIVFEENLPSEGGPLTCFTTYAITKGVNVAGGLHCGSDSAGVAKIASFDVSIGGSCGGVPKEEPVVEGVWTLLTVWGIPGVVDTVTVQLSGGSTVEIAAANGVAHQLWESSVGIESLEFDGMNDEQREVVANYLPAPGIDC